MSNTNRKKRRQRSEASQFKETNKNQELTLEEHRSGTFRVYNKKSKESVRGLSWEAAINLWRECNHCLILQDK